MPGLAEEERRQGHFATHSNNSQSIALGEYNNLKPVVRINRAKGGIN